MHVTWLFWHMDGLILNDRCFNPSAQLDSVQAQLLNSFNDLYCSPWTLILLHLVSWNMLNIIVHVTFTWILPALLETLWLSVCGLVVLISALYPVMLTGFVFGCSQFNSWAALCKKPTGLPVTKISQVVYKDSHFR